MTRDNGVSEWYKSNFELLSRFSNSLEELIRSLLQSHNVQYLGVSARVKKIDSILDKISRKKYSDPIGEVFDFVALRIITYLESDVKRVNGIVESNFNIDTNNSSNKSDGLGIDKVGYISQHYVCSLSDVRAELSENRRFAGMKFEIQIRTALQHAWAEIEHDRRYKFSGALPQEEARRFNLLAANLELLDAQFSELAQRIDDYSKNSVSRAEEGDLSEEINSVSVSAYLGVVKERNPLLNIKSSPGSAWAYAIDELKSLNVKTLEDLDEYFTPEFIQFSIKHYENLPIWDPATEIGILRDAMMYRDIDDYFENAWNHHWSMMDANTYDAFVEKLGEEHMAKILDTYNIRPALDRMHPDGYEWDD